MDLFDKMDKLRQDMDTEVKTSFKWVVLAAVFGLVVVLIFYVMVVRAHADPSDIAIRDQYGSFRGFAPNPNGLGALQRQGDQSAPGRSGYRYGHEDRGPQIREDAPTL